MAGIAAVFYILCVVVAAALVWFIARWQSRRRRRGGGVTLSSRLVPVMRAARRRAFVAVLFALVVFIAGAVAGVRMPEMLGQPFAVTPMVAAAAGVLLYAATPPRDVAVDAGQPRTATLAPRTIFTVVSRRWAMAYGEAVAFFVLVIVFCGLTASDDDVGRWSRVIRFESADVVQTAGPYPGWFYGIPALIALVVLVVATLIAVRRVNSTPAFPLRTDAQVDAQWRRRSIEVILGLSMGAILFSLGGVLLTAGFAMRNAVIDDGVTPVVWSVIGDTMWVFGFVVLAASIVSVTIAALTTLTIGEKVSQVNLATAL